MRIYTVDAFTDKIFGGNPAGVCILENDIGDELKQNIAAEMNLSETAFVTRQENEFGLRWFTPVSEVELCGHATLASAHILWETGFLSAGETAVFNTRYKGRLYAELNEEGIQLDFPSNPPSQTEHESDVKKCLQTEPVYIGLAGNHFLAELKSEKEVREYKPDIEAIMKLPRYGLIVTAASPEGRYDIVSRFFAPAVGVNEDPVTGSAHCVLGPYWGGRLGKNILKAYQASARGGELTVEVSGNRTLLTGKALTVIEGKMFVK